MAGFFAGFGEQLSTSIKDRNDKLDVMIKENLANARLAKRDYAKRTGLADQIIKSTQAIKDTYKLSDSQALALTEAYGEDLPRLQATLDAKNSELKSNLGVSYTADDVMSYVNTAQELNLPEGMTLQQGVERLMGLNYQELAKEANPKSEGSKTRSFIRAAFAYDPQLQAAEQMQNIKGPGGLSYAQLLEMQEAGFAPVDVFGGVTRSGGVTYDYTASTAKQTRTTYSSMLSTNVFDGSDLTDAFEYSDYSSSSDTDKASLKASVLGAGTALARLEKDIVLANRGKDLSMNAFRKAILDGIYDRVDSVQELDSLKESVANGTALKIVQRTGGNLTDADIDAIISGVVGEEESASVSEAAAATSVTELTAAEPPAAAATATAGAGLPAGPSTTTDAVSPIVARMLEEQGIDTGGISNTNLSDEELRQRESSAEAKRASDAAVIEEALARSDAIDDKLALQKREEALNDFDLPVPPRDLPPIDTLSINTPDDLRAAIEERTGTMPRDYLKAFIPLTRRINKQLKSFEESVNVSADKAEEAITIDNIGESLNNIMVRMFDTVVGDETLEERIMKNEGQRNRAAAFNERQSNRAAAFAKLQEQFAALTLFPERTPVDIKDIDPYPTMPEMASEFLHSTQDDVNASIASTAKAFLAKLGIGNSSEEGETKVEPLVARPEKPKEMTSSDKARLKRAQKANELSGDSGLLEMLVEKYGIALVQKEMGL